MPLLCPLPCTPWPLPPSRQTIFFPQPQLRISALPIAQWRRKSVLWSTPNLQRTLNPSRRPMAQIHQIQGTPGHPHATTTLLPEPARTPSNSPGPIPVQAAALPSRVLCSLCSAAKPFICLLLIFQIPPRLIRSRGIRSRTHKRMTQTPNRILTASHQTIKLRLRLLPNRIPILPRNL